MPTYNVYMQMIDSHHFDSVYDYLCITLADLYTKLQYVEEWVSWRVGAQEFQWFIHSVSPL